ncbi:MAG: alpha/beta fold hydrolase [Micropepsaceae bacterium]
MKTESVTFAGATGAALAARLEIADGEPRAFAIFAHCFTCGKDSMAAVRVSRALAGRGIATLRFDFSGIGASGGAFDETNFSSNVADLAAAAAHLRASHQAPSLLIGHSLGGAAVLAAAHLIPEARGVVTIGAPSDVTHVSHNFDSALSEIEARGQAEVQLGGRPFSISKQFLTDLQSQRIEDRIATLKRALLVMHSPIDAVVGIEHASRIFADAKHPKSFVSLDGADHYLKRVADADYAADIISTWGTRFLGAAGFDAAN